MRFYLFWWQPVLKLQTFLCVVPSLIPRRGDYTENHRPWDQELDYPLVLLGLFSSCHRLVPCLGPGKPLKLVHSMTRVWLKLFIVYIVSESVQAPGRRECVFGGKFGRLKT